MTEEFTIGSYKIQSQKAYDVMKKYNDMNDKMLAKFDKNNDKTITEDELVEVVSLNDDTNDEKSKNTSDDSTKEDDKIQKCMKQIDAYNEEITALETKREKAYERLQKSKEDNLSSIISECDGYTSQIQSVRGKIYELFVSMEEYEEELAQQNSDVSAATSGAISGLDNSTAATNSAIQSDTSAETNNKYTGSNQDFVNKFNSSSFTKGVFAGKGAMIASVAQKYGIDPNLLSAIMALETGWGTSSAVKNYNNPGGMMDPKTGSMTLLHYNSLQEGVEAVARNLKKNYIDKGLTSISAIGAKYCPVGAANDPNGTNSGWVPNVTSIYNKLAGANINANTKIA